MKALGAAAAVQLALTGMRPQLCRGLICVLPWGRVQVDGEVLSERISITACVDEELARQMPMLYLMLLS